MGEVSIGDYLLAAAGVAVYFATLAAIVAWLALLPTIGLLWCVGWLA